jgi:NADH-quinone oxidoreductase subunit M
MLRQRLGDDRFQSLGGLARQMPMFGVVAVVFALANAGLPGTNGFVGEFLVLLGAFPTFPVLVLLATIGVILAAAYLLWAVQRVLFGPSVVSESTGVRDLTRMETGIMCAFVAAIISLGVYPAPLLNRMQVSVASLVNGVTASAALVPGSGAGSGGQP